MREDYKLILLNLKAAYRYLSHNVDYFAVVASYVPTLPPYPSAIPRALEPIDCAPPSYDSVVGMAETFHPRSAARLPAVIVPRSLRQQRWLQQQQRHIAESVCSIIYLTLFPSFILICIKSMLALGLLCRLCHRRTPPL